MLDPEPLVFESRAVAKRWLDAHDLKATITRGESHELYAVKFIDGKTFAFASPTVLVMLDW